MSNKTGAEQAKRAPFFSSELFWKIFDKVKIAANILFFPILIILIWQLFAMSGQLLEVILPSPIKVWNAFLKMASTGLLAKDLSVSVGRVLIGYAWGAGLGLFFGILSGLFKFSERLLGTLVDFIRQIPPIAWMPLLILWFGIGDFSKVVLIAKGVFVPVFINTVRGVHGTSKEHIEVAKVLQLRYPKYLRRIVVPSALPSVFTGLRLGVGAAWMSVVAAEMLGGISGLGYQLIFSKDFLLSDQLIATMFVIGLIGLFTDRLLGIVERICFRWKQNESVSKN